MQVNAILTMGSLAHSGLPARDAMSADAADGGEDECGSVELRSREFLGNLKVSCEA